MGLNLSMPERKLIAKSKERIQHAQCFFCGSDSLGIIHIIRGRKVGEPVWLNSYNYCETHHDRNGLRKHQEEFKSIMRRLKDYFEHDEIIDLEKWMVQINEDLDVEKRNKL